MLDTVATGLLKNNPDARFSRLYFCHSLNRLQRGLSVIAELVVKYEDRIQNYDREIHAESLIHDAPILLPHHL